MATRRSRSADRLCSGARCSQTCRKSGHRGGGQRGPGKQPGIRYDLFLVRGAIAAVPLRSEPTIRPMSAVSIRGRLAAHWWEASAVAAAAFAVAFIVALLLHAAGSYTGAYLDNLTESGAAFLAAAVCGLTAVKSRGR